MTPLLLRISFFFLGFMASAFQIILIRELLVAFYGNELVLGFIYFWWFFSIALGAYLASKVPLKLYGPGSYFGILALLSLLPNPQIFLARALRVYLGLNPGEWIPLPALFLLTLTAIFPFAFAIGFIFPFAAEAACRVPSSGVPQKLSAGLVYRLESLGSMAAGIAVSLVLLSYFEHSTLALSMTCISIAIFGVWILPAIKSAAYKIVAAFGLVLAVLLYVQTAQGLLDHGLDLRWKGLSFLEKKSETDSVYQNIVIAKQGESFSLFSNGSYIGSFPDHFQPESLSHLFMSLHSDPKVVLFSSEGKEEYLKFLLKHGPERIDALSIDPKMRELVMPLLSESSKASFESERVRIVYKDLRRFLRVQGKKEYERYDLIISLSPDPSTLGLNRFFTREFFQDVKNSLRESGVFITGVSSSENYLSGDVGKYLGSVYKTARSVFEEVMVIPGTSSFIVCSPKKGAIERNPGLIIERLNTKGMESRFFRAENLSIYLQSFRIESIEEILKHNMDHYRINTDYNPWVFVYNLKILARHSDKISGHILGAAVKLNFFFYVSLIALFFLARLIYLGARLRFLEPHSKFNASLTIATTGMAGFSLELIIIYFYQSAYGYVYQMIGLVIGLFMLGLYAGAYAGNRAIEKLPQKMHAVILLCESSIMLFAFLLPFVFQWIPFEATVLCASLSAGALTGFEFPIANKIYFDRAGLIKAASIIDSLDHLGAAFGALLCGLILIPMLGIYETCLVLASLKLGTVILWLLSLLSGKVRVVNGGTNERS